MGNQDRRGGFDERRPRQGEREAWDRQERQDRQEPLVAPGKRTRTSQLRPRAPLPASVQQETNPATSATADAMADPAALTAANAAARSISGPQRADQAALTARWLDTAIRPDLSPPPGWRPPPVQRQTAGERAGAAGRKNDQALRANADRDAAALLAAFQGLGTDEQVIYRVLNQPPEVVEAIVSAYDARYNRHSGQGLVEDLREEFDEIGGQADWHFVLGQLTRAGISVPDAALRYQRQDPVPSAMPGATPGATIDYQGGARIVASPDVRVAVPGTRITYTLAHGTQGLHSLRAPYRYQWYVLNDPVTARMHGQPARVEGGEGPQAEATARFVGNHKVICKVVHRSGRGDGVPTFHEFPQTVVPEGALARDALAQVPGAVDPAQQLELLETFLQVLRNAEKQPGSAPLDPAVAAAYAQQIAALQRRLASTEGAERIPVQAVHIDREKARVSPLRVFVARVQGPGGNAGDAVARPAGNHQTWRLVDITNPESRRLSGEYEGTGRDARQAIQAALAAWNERNRYPAGRIQLELGAGAAGAPIAHTFQTDGMSFWDSISEFFAEVGFWTGMGALAAGVVSAVVPVPGMRIVSGLVWASIVASSASATIDLVQRHAEGTSTVQQDAMDLLTIAGNVLAGAWMLRGARVLVNGQGGSKIGTGLLIGQIGADGAQGIVLGIEYLAQYERVLAIRDPEQRTHALMELLRSAALTGGMLALSVQGTRSELDRLGQAGTARPGHLGNGGELDASARDADRAGHGAGSEPGAQAFETSLGRLQDRGIDQAQLERLAAALREAGLEARRLARIGDDTLARLVDPGVLGEIEQVARLQRSGRITGLDDWLAFGAAKDASDLGRVVGELREARRLVTENPGAVVNVGGDARAPTDPATGERMQSFDLTIESSTGMVTRSVEVTTVDALLKHPAGITSGVTHATSKIASRRASGQPVPGLRDATIRVTVARSFSDGKRGVASIDSAGNRVLHTRNGIDVPQGNLFDGIAMHLSRIPSHEGLDRITLVDAVSGAVVAQYDRVGAVWSRIR